MAVTIRGKTLPLPILQGGMGVGISLDGLAGAVAACGGMGTLSTAVCGFQEPDFAKRPFEANLRALDRHMEAMDCALFPFALVEEEWMKTNKMCIRDRFSRSCV